ncbi:uncharacterized protein EV420DRAFT_1501521 [Desarmillaria tabescens]|uniref:BTB domain-containing protein n=1 Tax=Armillaria tabescens TaxID=1929756 RepID=A0AA39NLQ4_ARMTA|nr:uncharacterized protein EV420DRAFT_1501521 [Desarmillaria tabescens]KAK0467839.1 hypothetical protein EV420DRAFT_1501521 [Desarmillaria tabescens]
MTLLHVHFSLRNQQAFQRLLDASSDRSVGISTSSSGGKSWSKGGAVGMAIAAEINGRDRLGRTVLHLACSSIDTLEYVRLLLRHLAVNVNVQDLESNWTPLHRALFHGNLGAVFLLLQRSDIDISLKDFEGYTAFELYNSTVEGTKPSVNVSGAEPYMWGANRNATLGLGDGDDRTYPDQVVIPRRDSSDSSNIYTRFFPLQVRQVQTSKLHTVIVTCEKKANLRLCGFGSGGRLGPGQHTQYSLTQLSQLNQTIVSVALGQDHTLALTDTGEVLSWGLNRFAQLGYIVETSSIASIGRIEEPIQSTPKKIVGQLKKEFVRGVAASKTSSACWTATEVFTWGTNNGQLGYDKSAQPVQVLPRKVTKITRPVTSVCLTDAAMICLLVTQEVICVWSDRSFKINFPAHGFPQQIQPYRPPQAIKGAHVSKIINCDDTVAALSSNGEIFLLVIPIPTEAEGSPPSSKAFVPQPAWTLKKQLSAAKDVAVGSDGMIIVCTESGHVFVRARKGGNTGSQGSGKIFKYQLVPYIQRVVGVCANSSGAFGAMRVDYKPDPISVHGHGIAEDLAEILLLLAAQPNTSRLQASSPTPAVGMHLAHEDEDEVDDCIEEDLSKLYCLSDVIRRQMDSHASEGELITQGADILISTDEAHHTFSAHRVILSARSSVLLSLLQNPRTIRDDSQISVRYTHTSGHHRLMFFHCLPMSVLILLDYLYSDHLLSVWDRRLSFGSHLDSARIKSDLQVLAKLLHLPSLLKAIQSPVKVIPEPTMIRDMTSLFSNAQIMSKEPDSPQYPDVVLQFQDKDVFCHSTLLRARTVFFADFFTEEDWTRNRRDRTGRVHVNMKHMKWHVMQYVLRFVCCGEDVEMFETLEFAHSVESVLEFMFEVMAAAAELHLDRLLLISSSIILNFLNIQNACYILSEATHYSAKDLINAVQGYIAVNLESFLESRMLDVLSPALVKQLSCFVQERQITKSPITRRNYLGKLAMERHAEWLSLQDFPSPIVRSNKQLMRRDSVRLSPSSKVQHSSVRATSLAVKPQGLPASTGNDDIFAMDDVDPISTANLDQPNPSAPWKSTSVARVDMRAVMAEAAREVPARSIVPRNLPNADDPSRRQVSLHKISEGSSSSPSLRRIPPNATGSPSRIDTPNKFPKLSSSPVSTPKAPSASIIKPFVATGSSSTLPGLGPVISPQRQPSSAKPKHVGRNVSSGKAWTSPSQLDIPTPSVSGMSFSEIQQSQQESSVLGKARRSLLEIQMEEQARREEEAFMKWWVEEEERVKREAEATAEALKASTRKNKRGGGRAGRSVGGPRKKGGVAPSNS